MRSSYINPGDKVSISVKVSDGPRRSYISYIDTIVDEETILIYTPIFKGQVIPAPTTPILIFFTSLPLFL